MGEHMQERIDPADMIHQQKGEGPVRRPRRLELIQHPSKIESGRLAFAGSNRS